MRASKEGVPASDFSGANTPKSYAIPRCKVFSTMCLGSQQTQYGRFRPYLFVQTWFEGALLIDSSIDQSCIPMIA